MAREKKAMAKRSAILIVVLFLAAILCIAVFLNIRNNRELHNILEDSVKAQLISISLAAEEIIDTDRFISYNSIEDVQNDQAAYDQTLGRLRHLAENVGAEYIYALKEIDGKYYFVFDTDPEDEEIFIDYELSPVHMRAFSGNDSADIMNVDDIYGSFNTGAVPIKKDGKVVGIVSTDIADAYLTKSTQAETTNTILLVGTLAGAMVAMILFVLMLLRRNADMQKRLNRLAHYDTITDLPNRQYLLEHLAEITSGKNNRPFALLFIDLDNFKSVNDGAGHDAGDELLRHIAQYLDLFDGNRGKVQAFRPSAGKLNIAARIGGDEFIEIVSGVGTVEEASAVAQTLLKGFRETVNDRYVEKYGVGLSIGVALYPYHSDNFHVLIKYADIAMYHAKRGGKNNYRIYDDDMEPKEEK
ncbi:MAG: diguanylate cyclase domain-containing protein [Christensenellaceae bacterium]|jgi:diguanylate cyclase (GGDEF)-like protein